MAVSCIEKINTTEFTVRILKLYNLHFFFFFLLHIKNSTNSLMKDKARQITVTQHFFSPFWFRSRLGITDFSF